MAPRVRAQVRNRGKSLISYLLTSRARASERKRERMHTSERLYGGFVILERLFIDRRRVGLMYLPSRVLLLRTCVNTKFGRFVFSVFE